MRQILSSIGLAIIIALIFFLNVYLYYVKIWMRESDSIFLATNAANIFCVLVSICISVVNVVYAMIAERMTELEIHRTDTEHKDALIFKLFFVQFINAYISLYYTAFVMKYVEGDCGGRTCTDDLCYLLATILAERLVFTVLFDNLLPRFMSWRRYLQETKGTNPDDFSEAEKQYVLEQFDTELDVITRYMDQVIMFGYMVLFVAAFPMAPFLGYASNIFQIHQFGHMLLFRKQRNLPFGAQDIGTFQMCFEAQAAVAVVTNSGLVFYTMGTTYFPDNYPQSLIVWIFFGTQLAIFKLMEVIRVVIPNVSEKVELQLKRQDHFKSKIFELRSDVFDSNAEDRSCKFKSSEGYQEKYSLENSGLVYKIEESSDDPDDMY